MAKDTTLNWRAPGSCCSITLARHNRPRSAPKDIHATNTYRSAAAAAAAGDAAAATPAAGDDAAAAAIPAGDDDAAATPAAGDDDAAATPVASSRMLLLLALLRILDAMRDAHINKRHVHLGTGYSGVSKREDLGVHFLGSSFDILHKAEVVNVVLQTTRSQSQSGHIVSVNAGDSLVWGWLLA